MERLKEYITVGYRHLQMTGPDRQTWSNRMIGDFGEEILPRLSEIREWSLILHSRNRGPVAGRMNCWEFMQCGREAGGTGTNVTDACPASTQTSLHSIHGGTNAGRACWTVDGTLCCNRGPEALEAKKATCRSCSFYRSLLEEENSNLLVSDEMLLLLQS